MMLRTLTCSLTTRALAAAADLLPVIKTNGSALSQSVGTEFIMAAAHSCQRYWQVLRDTLLTPAR